MQREAGGRVIGLKIPYSDRVIPRLASHRLFPGELLRADRWAEAEDAYCALRLDESRITYAAYELLKRRPSQVRDQQAARVLRTVAQAQYPSSSIVALRWAEYYLLARNTTAASAAYRRALSRNPTDRSVRELLERLGKP